MYENNAAFSYIHELQIFYMMFRHYKVLIKIILVLWLRNILNFTEYFNELEI